jgi:hypothetical protein
MKFGKDVSAFISPDVVSGQAILSCLPRLRRRQALAGQVDAMRIVHEAVQNGVGVIAVQTAPNVFAQLRDRPWIVSG